MKYRRSRKIRNDAKKVFYKKGTCSRTFFYLLNREYGHPLDDGEKAADPLAGGILQHGYQCGMLWGASMGVAAEEGLSLNQDELPQRCMSCASEVVKRMGGTDVEMVMVAGLAGGMGMSGNACGALGAAIWMKALINIRENKRKTDQCTFEMIVYS